jgi:Protein of unknown function (DUF1329)
VSYPNHVFRLITAIAVIGICHAHAAVSEEEAKQLGGPVLTMFGSEKAGNKEGTIPPYANARADIPKDWDPKNPYRHPDPYNEKPLFSITAANAAQYADKLDGMIELFKRYPDYRMDIYPSHRNYVMPQQILDNTIKNATACKAINTELTLQGCRGGMPFPIPKTGNQAMWNHLVGYQAWTVKGRAEAWIIPPKGDPVLVTRSSYINNWPSHDPANVGPLGPDALYFRYLATDEAPARNVGGKLMMLDPIDQLKYGRRAYLYTSGRRWVKLAANLAYDTPTPYAGGSATMDDAQAFMGALDRYNFELVGKKEKYISYDNFGIIDTKICSTEKINSTKGFPHPDCIRWELHRVWVVKAALKSSASHIYPKRIFYWDEDGFEAGMAENYDANGKVFRFSTNVYFPYYEAPGGNGTTNIYQDLQSGIWVSSGFMNSPNCGFEVLTTPLPDDTFIPDAMAGAGIR